MRLMPGGPRTSRLLPRPHQVSGVAGPWDRVAEDLRRYGVGLVSASLADWEANRPGDAELRALLGRDWGRYVAAPNPRLRERFVASRALVKYVAAAAVRAVPEELELGYALTGRLYVRGCDQVDLSLTHCGDLLFVGVTSLGVIGVDAEPADRTLCGMGVERLMCTPWELAMLAETPADQHNARLLGLWTLKEAYSKALGQGLLFPFTEFGFEVSDGRPAELRRADGTPVGDLAWTFRTMPVGGRYLGAVALHDTGRGPARDTAVGTALDQGLSAAIHRSLNARDA
ncbi:MAG TPA: 4'-phosphopantetheinyl transferase superfamily protein [Mycobacteriales bacterium]|nr:4'-phosphopantetheinyl transferase superfamily protein [Mycobacteriales bacterium]